MKRRLHLQALRQPVPSWAFLLAVLGIVGAILAGYSVLNNNSKNIRAIIINQEIRSDKRDVQFCDVANFYQDLKPFVPRKYLPRLRRDINKFLRDINQDKTECHALPAKPVLIVHPPKNTTPQPTVTTTRTVLVPGGGTKTIVVTKRPAPPVKHKHHKKAKPPPTNIICLLPSPVPPIGGCK